MIFKTKEDLKKRLTYIWDFADKNSDIDFMLNELWKDIEETKVKNLAQPDVIREVCECESDYLQCNEFGKCPQCGKYWG